MSPVPTNSEARLQAARQTSGTNYGNIAVTLFLFGGALLIFATHEFVLSAGSDHWPTTTATVVSSRLITKSRGPSSPSVIYRYVVNEQTYTAKRIHFFLITSSSISSRLVGRYPTGLVLNIHFNPTYPSVAILEPTPWVVGYIELIVSMTLLVLGRRASIRGKAQQASITGIQPNPPQDLDQRLQALLIDGRKIEAIKLYHELTQLGLKESKDYVDSLEAKSPPVIREK